jgi:hypothetical protein
MHHTRSVSQHWQTMHPCHDHLTQSGRDNSCGIKLPNTAVASDAERECNPVAILLFVPHFDSCCSR